MTPAVTPDFCVVLVARLGTSASLDAQALRDDLRALPAVNADAIASRLGVPVCDAGQIAEMMHAMSSCFAFEAVLDQSSRIAELDTIRQAGYELVLVASGSEPTLERQQTRAAAGWLPVVIERTAASLICDASAGLPQPVLLLEGTRTVERSDPLPSWVGAALLQPLQQRADDLQKLVHFTEVNELTLQCPDTTAGLYEGRMQVQTRHFITQHVSRRTLVVHDKSLIGLDWQPGQALCVHYGQYLPDGGTVLVSHLVPSRLKALNRA